MLGRIVSLHDIGDVEGFVASAIERFTRDSQITIEDEERTELKLQGLLIMYELERKFEPHRAGYAQAGRFSGYAAFMLPKRLGDYWHQIHPEHKRITRPDGKREWVYLKGTVSLDEQLAPHRGFSFGGEAGGQSRTSECQFLHSAKWTAVPVAAAA